jgi:hypothetical protein
VGAREGKNWHAILVAELERRITEVNATGLQFWCHYQYSSSSGSCYTRDSLRPPPIYELFTSARLPEAPAGEQRAPGPFPSVADRAPFHAANNGYNCNRGRASPTRAKVGPCTGLLVVRQLQLPLEAVEGFGNALDRQARRPDASAGDGAAQHVRSVVDAFLQRPVS